ncbi:MAG: zf-HC2 domain-containing protein [Anaerolineales bacterium]|nr:zf-HC2 domain-containing protein [Anaerolineales bacterium]MCB9126350.1 zf-HC2 domain-containing protein [Ardenticatenales bacterium]
MHERWDDQLPFYVTGALPPATHAAVAQHLRECVACAAQVAEWQQLAAWHQSHVAGRMGALPPLSPLVRASLHRPPTLRELLASTLQLVWAQRNVLRPLLPGIVGVLLVGLAASLGLMNAERVALPLVALVPIVAALPIAFLHSRELEPAFEIVSATPSAPGALLLARLTFVLTLVSSVTLPGSFAVSAAQGSSFGPLVAAWLGPLLLLSALATVLALRWRSGVAVGVVLAGWLGVIGLLWLELNGYPLLALPLHALLQPHAWLFLSQLLAAGLLWWLAWRELPHLSTERVY